MTPVACHFLKGESSVSSLYSAVRRQKHSALGKLFLLHLCWQSVASLLFNLLATSSDGLCNQPDIKEHEVNATPFVSGRGAAILAAGQL